MARQASEDRRYPRSLPDVKLAAQRAVSALGWRLGPATDGGIDAVWSGRLLPFKDDVAIRLTAASGTFVRIRSASRFALFDFGQNARHVKEFFQELDRQLALMR